MMTITSELTGLLGERTTTIARMVELVSALADEVERYAAQSRQLSDVCTDSIHDELSRVMVNFEPSGAC